jgi:hypothetical protein
MRTLGRVASQSGVFPVIAHGRDVREVLQCDAFEFTDDAVVTVCSDGVMFVAELGDGVRAAEVRLTPEQIERVRRLA